MVFLIILPMTHESLLFRFNSFFNSWLNQGPKCVARGVVGRHQRLGKIIVVVASASMQSILVANQGAHMNAGSKDNFTFLGSGTGLNNAMVRCVSMPGTREREEGGKWEIKMLTLVY